MQDRLDKSRSALAEVQLKTSSSAYFSNLEVSPLLQPHDLKWKVEYLRPKVFLGFITIFLDFYKEILKFHDFPTFSMRSENILICTVCVTFWSAPIFSTHKGYTQMEYMFIYAPMVVQ